MKWEAKFVEHRGENKIAIYFEKNPEAILRIKKLVGVKWSNTLKAWLLPDNDIYRKQFGLDPKPILDNQAFVNIHDINREPFQKLIDELQLRAYSPNTIQTYKNEFAQLLQIIKENHIDSLDDKKLRSYFLYCINTLKLSENTLHSRMNAIKFYYEKVLKNEKIFFEIPRPKKPSILPKVIHAVDIKKIFENATNPKHNLMLKLCYGMGLRVSEIVNLKITDIDSKNMQVLIEHAKGKKDRYVNLPESILEQLRAYYKTYKPKKYLFEGQYGGQYSIRSVQQVFNDNLKKANINKTIGIHGLRHSFATHLLESGTDITYIKDLLGHKDLKTTLRYIHVSKKTIKNIKSPLDTM